jgi:hypothetical protein
MELNNVEHLGGKYTVKMNSNRVPGVVPREFLRGVEIPIGPGATRALPKRQSARSDGRGSAVLAHSNSWKIYSLDFAIYTSTMLSLAVWDS